MLLQHGANIAARTDKNETAIDLINQCLKTFPPVPARGIDSDADVRKRLLETREFLQKALAARKQAAEKKEGSAVEKKEAAEKKVAESKSQVFPGHDFAVRFVKLLDEFVQQNTPVGTWNDNNRKQVLDLIERMISSTSDLSVIDKGLRNIIEEFIRRLYKGDEKTIAELRKRLMDSLSELIKELLGRLQAAAEPREPRRRDDEGSAGAMAKLRKHMRVTPGGTMIPKKVEPTVKKKHRGEQIIPAKMCDEISA